MQEIENSKIVDFLEKAKSESLIAAVALAAIYGIVECTKNNSK